MIAILTSTATTHRFSRRRFEQNRFGGVASMSVPM
jgi:hypothetical protein